MYIKGETMNLELIATKIGNYVKYTTTINEINRAAKPIFKFPRQEFPNESITSDACSTNLRLDFVPRRL